MKSQVGPGSKALASVSDYEQFLAKDEVVVIGFFKKDSDLKTAYFELVDKLREKITFGHSSDEDVLKAANVK